MTIDVVPCEEVEDIARMVSGSDGRRTAIYSVQMAAMRALTSEHAPYQTDPGEEQQSEHDVAEIPVVQAVIGPGAEPRADDRCGESDQYQPDCNLPQLRNFCIRLVSHLFF